MKTFLISFASYECKHGKLIHLDDPSVEANLTITSACKFNGDYGPDIRNYACTSELNLKQK